VPESQDAIKVINAAIVKVLRPLIRMAIKRGISYGIFSSWIKWIYYDVAKNDFKINDRMQSYSRISLLTGFSRKEAKHLAEIEPPISQDQFEQCNRSARVISGWQIENDFINEEGKPIVLPIYGAGVTFEKLVRKYSGDIPTRAVIDELLRFSAVKIESNQRIRLIKEAFIPTYDEVGKFEILGTDVGLLISTIEKNIELKNGKPLFQRKVYYDNLPDEVMTDIKRMSGKLAQGLIGDMNRYIAINDRDVNPKIGGDGRNIAGIGVYYFEKPYK
jgi:hypothetical protein